MFEDPYKEMVSRNDTYALAESFRFFWLADRTYVNRDMAFLFTDAGHDIFYGRVYVGSICDENRR